jgi:hypothetical protein
MQKNPSFSFSRLSILLLTILTSSTLAAKYEDTIKESFNTNGAGFLKLQLQSSQVKIETHAGSEASIEITRTLRHGDKSDFEGELKNVEVTFEQSGNEISCVLKYDQNNKPWSFLFNRNRKLNFRTVVKLPNTFDVEVHSSGGAIEIGQLTGNALLHTSGGSINMDNMDGTVVAKTSGGSIKASNCNGDVEFRTSGGSIKAEDILGNLVGKTSGGNIEINDVSGDTAVSTSGGSIQLGIISGNVDASTSGGGIRANISGQPTRDCTLKTSGGSIHLAVNEGANIEIDASTSGGSVKSDLTLTNQEAKKTSLKGRLNKGGPTLTTRTSGGSIYINSI